VPETDALLRMFFYGTLKRGQANHDRFCRSALRTEPATALGHLYGMPFGFPGLHVREGDVRAVGTSDYLADTFKQRQSPPALPASDPGWDLVHGELFAFEDPEERLATLDAFEGYTPGENGMYERVLIPVRTHGEILLAWAYQLKRPAGTYLPGGCWPAEGPV
jgi:gamma-glutamylcyclotransferase (GGCT)/AIG2-like uncharacterized protein YtfP